MIDIYCPSCGMWQKKQLLPRLYPEPSVGQWKCPSCLVDFRFEFVPIELDDDKFK